MWQVAEGVLQGRIAGAKCRDDCRLLETKMKGGPIAGAGQSHQYWRINKATDIVLYKHGNESLRQQNALPRALSRITSIGHGRSSISATNMLNLISFDVMLF